MKKLPRLWLQSITARLKWIRQEGVRIPEGSVLDLGGIAKGYVWITRSYLVKHRMQRAIVNAGDISVIGAS